MDQLSHTLQDVPLAGLVPLGLLLLVGLLLWAAGYKVFRAGFAAAGFLLGGVLGWLIGGAIDLGTEAWIVTGILALLAGCVAALTYRLAIAGALAIVLGVAAPLGALTVHEWQTAANDHRAPHEEPLQAEDDHWPGDMPPDASDTAEPESGLDEIDRWLRERFDEEFRKRLPQGIEYSLRNHDLNEELAEQLSTEFEGEERKGYFFTDELDEHVEAVRTMAQRTAQALREAWLDAPESLRPILALAAGVGLVLGLLIGALVPTFSTSIVTAFLGALLWLGSVRIFAEKMDIVEQMWLPTTGTGWLTMWVVFALLGLAIQWTVSRRKADK